MYDNEAISSRLDLLNRMALEDETGRSICYPMPQPTPDALRLLGELDQETQRQITTKDLTIWSFDIDLTLAMPEDTDGCRGPIAVAELIRLQQQPATIVGTCSDREPSAQRSAMKALEFNPDFCIPKEMLGYAARMFPDSAKIHVGDDPDRDRAIAEKNGWEHHWPNQANGSNQRRPAPARHQ